MRFSLYILMGTHWLGGRVQSACLLFVFNNHGAHQLELCVEARRRCQPCCLTYAETIKALEHLASKHYPYKDPLWLTNR